LRLRQPGVDRLGGERHGQVSDGCRREKYGAPRRLWQ
jgi:hypothetical protein